MAQLDTLDILVLVALLLGTVAYLTKGKYWGVTKDPYAASLANGSLAGKGAAAGKTRDILKKMEESNKNCIVFYGSQTGTAEDYASRLAKEGSSRFGLATLVADIEEYDFENLDQFPEDKVAFFVLATYGEGEPTDNAVEFNEFIMGDDVAFSEKSAAEGNPLESLKYVAFGLGNNTYEHYNSMVRNIDKRLSQLGATRIGTAGEGDDGQGTLEEDFLAWKETMWAALSDAMNLEEREAGYEPVFEITEREDLSAQSDTVYLGEPNKNHLEGISKGPYSAHNPYIAPIASSRELFQDKSRNCLHMEIDISGSNLTYTTGDHIAIWPTNPGKEVDRFLSVIGMDAKRDTVIIVKGIDATAKLPFPTPTTYETILRYQLEINAPVSRQFVGTLAQFAPSPEIKEKMTKLGSDKDAFASNVAQKNFNIAQLLQSVGPGAVWSAIPFTAWIEGLNKIQPRYYSISSSSLVQPKRIAITAAVDSVEIAGAPHIVKGVTTNYLLALQQKQHGVSNPDPNGLNYALTGPRNKYDGIHVPVHVRHATFKLPSDPAKPVIMVGPGTGVAPFRGFVQERAQQAKNGDKVGKTLLFFGCRNRQDDFVYEDEWKQYAADLNGQFELITAFSREGAQKVYVQHKLRERAAAINELLEKEKAYFYICGDAAHMAREVNETLVDIIASERKVEKRRAEEIVKAMRASNQFQEDVWS